MKSWRLADKAPIRATQYLFFFAPHVDQVVGRAPTSDSFSPETITLTNCVFSHRFLGLIRRRRARQAMNSTFSHLAIHHAEGGTVKP